MPRKTASGAGKRKDARQAIVESALTLAASRGWARVGLGDIAEAAEVSLAEVREAFSSKTAIVVAYTADIDRAVLAARDPEMAGRPATERLFDVLMKRFDLLNAHKDGVGAIVRSCPSDPEAILCGPVMLRRSMRWMLEAADLSSAGLRAGFESRRCPRFISPCCRSGSATTAKTWRAPWPCSTSGSGASTDSRGASAVPRRGAAGARPGRRRKPDRVRT